MRLLVPVELEVSVLVLSLSEIIINHLEMVDLPPSFLFLTNKISCSV